MPRTSQQPMDHNVQTCGTDGQARIVFTITSSAALKACHVHINDEVQPGACCAPMLNQRNRQPTCVNNHHLPGLQRGVNQASPLPTPRLPPSPVTLVTHLQCLGHMAEDGQLFVTSAQQHLAQVASAPLALLSSLVNQGVHACSRHPQSGTLLNCSAKQPDPPALTSPRGCLRNQMLKVMCRSPRHGW